MSLPRQLGCAQHVRRLCRPGIGCLRSSEPRLQVAEHRAQHSSRPSLRATVSTQLPLASPPSMCHARRSARRACIRHIAVSIAPEKKTYTVPAGTKVLLELRSAINTKSAKARRRRLPVLHLSRRGRKSRHDPHRRLRPGSG